MASRLTDLLDRLRPTGAPGASAAVGARPSEQADEFDGVVVILRQFEAEAEAVTVQARQRADELQRQARQQVRAIDDELPDRLAIAGSTTHAEATDRAAAERSRVDIDTAAEIKRIEGIAPAAVGKIANQATDMLWAAFLSDADDSETT